MWVDVMYMLYPILSGIFRDVNFSNRLKVDCSRFYFCECMEVISLGNQAKKYGVVPFTRLGEDLE